LLDDIERQVNEDPFSAAEFASPAANASQPFLADSITQHFSRTDGLCEHIDRMHPSFSRLPRRASPFREKAKYAGEEAE
jgi:hypothetical protein